MLKLFGSKEKQIDLQSKCPACGHRGCTLKFILPPRIEDEKGRGEFRIEDAKVQRTCTVCGAQAYENTVLPPEKWVAK